MMGVQMRRRCPDCGAYLDPGEICDCKEEAAYSAANTIDGKENLYTSIVTEYGGKVNG